MENNQNQRYLKELRAYIPKAIKFYDLKRERLAQVVFLLVMAIYLVSEFVLFRKFENKTDYDLNDQRIILIISGISYFLVELVSSIYLYAYLSELKGKEYSFAKCLKIVFGNAVNITITIIFYGLAVAFGMLLFIVPGLILYVMYMFALCYVVDLKVNVKDAFEASKYVTKGSRRQIFGIALLFKILSGLPVFLAASTIDRFIISNFVFSFGIAAISLMQTRLTALMYYDLEYGEKGSEIDIRG